MPERRPHNLRARLSEPARAGWDRWCTEHGVTLTAILEALGEQMAKKGATVSPATAVKRARKIDVERRSRR